MEITNHIRVDLTIHDIVFLNTLIEFLRQFGIPRLSLGNNGNVSIRLDVPLDPDSYEEIDDREQIETQLKAFECNYSIYKHKNYLRIELGIPESVKNGVALEFGAKHYHCKCNCGECDSSGQIWEVEIYGFPHYEDTDEAPMTVVRGPNRKAAHAKAVETCVLMGWEIKSWEQP